MGPVSGGDEVGKGAYLLPRLVLGRSGHEEAKLRVPV